MSAEKKKTILLVEDEVITAMAGKITLENFGNKVMTAFSGEEAVETVEKTPAIDLVLMDINLGAGIDGTEAAEIILRGHDLPVVFLSGHTEPKTVEKTEKITSYGYVVKNSNATVLDASIKMAFKLFEAKTKEKEKESQREAALEALRESEERYRNLFNKVDEGFCVVEMIYDPDGKAVDYRFVEINPAFEKHTGLHQAQGKTIRQMVPDHDAHWFEIYGKVARTGEAVRFEKPALAMQKYYTVFAFRIGGEGSRRVGILFSDITGRQRAEEALRESEEKYRTLVEKANEAITIAQDGVLIFANRRMSDLLGVPAAALQGKPFIDFVWPDDRELVRANYWKRIAGEPASDNYDFRIIGAGGRLTWVLFSAAVIRWQGKPATLNLLTDITERKRVDEALKISETLFRELYDNMKSGSAIFTVINDGSKGSDYIVKKINNAGLKMEGKTLEQVAGKKFIDIRPAIDSYGLIPVMKKVWETGKEAIFSTKMYMDERCSNYYENFIFKLPSGEIVTLYDDVTERKRIEEELRESEERYRTLFENTGTSTIIIEEDGTINLVNKEFARRTGYARSEIEGVKKWTEIIDKEDIERMLAQHKLRRESPGDALASYEFRYRTKSGELRYALIHVQLLPGTRKSVASIIDITLRKQTESQREVALEELKKSSQLLTDSGEIANVGGWELDLSSKELSWTEEVCRIHGVEPGYKPTLAEAINFYAPEHRWAIEAVLKKAKETGEPFELEVLFIPRGSKDKIWVRSLGKAVYSDGKIAKLAGTIQNIDKYKRVETALGESEVRFRELFNRMSSGVTVYEAVDNGGDFIIRDFNPAAERIEQVSSKDVLGKRVSEAFPGVKAFGIFKVFQRVWRTGEAEYFPENIYKNEKDSGSWRESWRESWVFKLPTDEIVAIYNDISERKQAEEEIKRQLAEKMILLKEVHHRIKNNIASIGGLLSLQAQAVTNPEAIAVLQDAIGRVNSMRILYDKMLLTEGYKDISVKNYVESLAASVVALFPDSAKVTIEQRISDFQLDPKQLSPLGIIINELLTNIMKHAFTNRDAGLIKISLAKIDKHVTLTIQDDGNGLPAGFDINGSEGFGLILVKMLSQQLGGSFSIKMHEGTICTVEFNI